ncbi:flagellar filament capping protein FliD [Lacunisphaera limnophila]|nr:flagellar filament capping protein FliD [Lacunisphaera limnophila]
MATMQLSGLASGLDWKSLVDQLMDIERAPIDRIEREQLVNTQQSNALKDLNTRLATLQTASTTLSDQSLFSGRTAASGTTGSTWNLAATSGTAAGSYAFNVTQLATKARREGAADITSGLNTTADVSGLTLATLRTASIPTAGTFTINGTAVTVATTDSLDTVFAAIATATGNDVTASYDPLTDRITLDSATDAEIVLGAANDTSNLLAVLKLANNGTGTLTSHGTLGSARTNSTFATAGLRTAITAVDGTGAGSFTLNGVNVAYNVNTDSISTVVKRINASGAGVTASYDAVNDRMTLANNTTGDLGMTVSESAGGLLGALGLTSGHTVVRGENAEFSVNNGGTIISTSNTLDATAHGITGLTVTADSTTAETITVGADTAKMKEKIDAFITAFNAVGLFIDEKTRVTSTNGKVTTNVLTNNREVQAWQRDLRSLGFSAIAGLGAVDRLDDLGIVTDRDGRLSVGDTTKLEAALTDSAADVEAFFTTATTGFAAKFKTRVTAMIDSGDGVQERLAATNSTLDRQIADLERRLVQQRELLTSGFIAMESAQSQIQQQSSAIANAFGTSSS